MIFLLVQATNYLGYSLFLVFFSKTSSGCSKHKTGIVVDTYMANVIRGHTDIKNDSAEAKHWVKSRQYYDQLSTKLVRNGHCVDAFLNALDQVGFAEMRSCVALTGGSCLLADSFANEKFVESFRKVCSILVFTIKKELLV